MAECIGINGMGVVGREMLRYACFKLNMEVGLINDPNISVENLAYLLNHDSVYHDYDMESKDNKFYVKSGELYINGKRIPFTQETGIENLQCGDNGINIVLDCTGKIASSADLEGYTVTGAKQAIACYPIENTTLIVDGINDIKSDMYLVSMPSIEMQVAALLLSTLNDNYGIDAATVSFISPYTNGLHLEDSFDNTAAERGRAAAWNIIPQKGKTFDKSIGKVVAQLNGSVTSNTYTVPVIAGGAITITFKPAKTLDTDNIESLFDEKTHIVPTNDPLVSFDAVGRDTFPLLLGSVQSAGDLVKMTVLYDNIRGLVAQTLRTVAKIMAF